MHNFCVLKMLDVSEPRALNKRTTPDVGGQNAWKLKRNIAGINPVKNGSCRKSTNLFPYDTDGIGSGFQTYILCVLRSF